jgi:hypothetical protein
MPSNYTEQDCRAVIPTDIDQFASDKIIGGQGQSELAARQSSSDGGSKNSSQPTSPTSVDVESWDRILRLHEQYQRQHRHRHRHQHPPRRRFSSPVPSPPPKWRNMEGTQLKKSNSSSPKMPLCRQTGDAELTRTHSIASQHLPDG